MKMKDIIIVCDDSFGLDVKGMVLAINKYHYENDGLIPYNLKGFVGSENMSDKIKRMFSPYLGDYEKWIPSNKEVYAMGIVNPFRKKNAVEKLEVQGAIFETLRAPWVLAHLDFEFPEGCIIAAQSVMDSAKIGRFVTLYHSMVGFDAVVDDYASVMAFSNITTAHIGEQAYIDNNVVIIGKTVNAMAIVKPNSVVVKEVKEGITVSGNPARKVKQ